MYFLLLLRGLRVEDCHDPSEDWVQKSFPPDERPEPPLQEPEESDEDAEPIEPQELRFMAEQRTEQLEQKFASNMERNRNGCE